MSENFYLLLNKFYLFIFISAERLHQRWGSLQNLFHSRLMNHVSNSSFEERTVIRQSRTVLETRLVDSNPHFRQLQDCIDWVKNKLVSFFKKSSFAYISFLCIRISENVFIFAILHRLTSMTVNMDQIYLEFKLSWISPRENTNPLSNTSQKYNNASMPRYLVLFLVVLHLRFLVEYCFTVLHLLFIICNIQ